MPLAQDIEQAYNYGLPEYLEAGIINLLNAKFPYHSPMVARKLGNILTKGFLGQLGTVANGADHTTAIQMALEADYDAVRVGILNSVAAPITGVKIRMSAGGAASAASASGAIAPADGSWPIPTFAGSTSVTLPAGTPDLPSITFSDWTTCNSLARTDGGVQPLLWVRVLIPAANANRPAWNYATLTKWETESEVAGRIFRCRTQAVNGVDTLGNMTIGGSVSNYLCVPVYVQYASRKFGLTTLVIGDSIYEKAGATARYGWQDIAQAGVSTPDTPIEICTAAIGGSNSTTWRARLESLIAAIQPDYVLMPGFEVNDANAPLTQANINLMRGQIERAIATCRENNVVPIQCTGLPVDTTGTLAKLLGAGDPLRRSLNDRLRVRTDRQYILDFDSATAGNLAGNGQVEFRTGLTTDALHPNDAGHQAMATQQVIPLFRKLLQINGLT